MENHAHGLSSIILSSPFFSEVLLACLDESFMAGSWSSSRLTALLNFPPCFQKYVEAIFFPEGKIGHWPHVT